MNAQPENRNETAISPRSSRDTLFRQPTSVLEELRIASPCRASWASMEGDDRVRFCQECKLNVYNLSAMSRTDAENLVARTEGRLCVRMYRRADGTVLTRDCPVGLRGVRRRIALLFSWMVLAMLSLWAMASRRHPEPVMGDIAPVSPPVNLPVGHTTGALAVTPLPIRETSVSQQAQPTMGKIAVKPPSH